MALDASSESAVNQVWDLLVKQLYGRNPFTFKFTDLIDTGTDTNPTFGNVTAKSLTTNGGGTELTTGANAVIGGNLQASIVNAVSTSGYAINGASVLFTAGGHLQVRGTDADGATAIGLVVNTNVAFATSGAKIASFQNNSVEKAYFDKDGNLQCAAIGNLGAIAVGAFNNINVGNTVAAGTNVEITSGLIDSLVPDGASAIAYTFRGLGSGSGYVTAGAKIVSFQNGAVEKAFVDLNGTLTAVGGFATSGIQIGSTNILANNSITAGTNVIVASGTGVQIVLQSGKFTTASYTDSSGTPGNVTNNSVTGRAAVASGAQTCAVANSSMTANSIVMVQLETAGAGIDEVVVSAHSSSGFTVTTMKNGAPSNTTANATFSWVITN